MAKKLKRTVVILIFVVLALIALITVLALTLPKKQPNGGAQFVMAQRIL